MAFDVPSRQGDINLTIIYKMSKSLPIRGKHVCVKLKFSNSAAIVAGGYNCRAPTAYISMAIYTRLYSLRASGCLA